MSTITTEPITNDWTTTDVADPTAAVTGDAHDDDSHATASDVNSRLGALRVSDIDDALVPFMAAAAAEMALGAGISWRFSADDPPVALLRLLAVAGIRNPGAGGPHTDRLLAQLQRVSGSIS